MNIDGSAVLRRLLVLGLCLALGVGLVACGDDDSSSAGGTTPSGEASGEGEESSGGEAAEASEVDQVKIGELNFDMSKYCGDKPTVVGSIDGFGGNPWRVETRALIRNTAEECPNVTEVKYFDANLDPERFNSTVRGWAAQGVNIIVAYDDFGQSAVPAFKAAQQLGVKVVTHNAMPGNAQIPTDVTAAVMPNIPQGSREWVEFLDEATKGGQIALVGGTPGNLLDGPTIEAMQAAIEETGAGVELVEDEPVIGNFEPAKTQQATAALLNKYPDLAGVAMTYTAMAPAVNRAFEAAGKPLPAIAGVASSNEVICEWRDKQKSEPTFELLSLDGSANQAALALAKGMAAYQEIDAPELGPTDEHTISAYAPYIDTLSGKVPPCVRALPGGADLSTALTQDEIEELLG